MSQIYLFAVNSATSHNWGYHTDKNSQNACLGLENVSKEKENFYL
jgi:hypothetical protein